MYACRVQMCKVMSFLWLLLALASLLRSANAQGFGINLIKIPEEDRGQIICTIALLEKYFYSGESLSGSVLHVSLTTAALHIQKSLIQALHENPKYPWTVVVKDVHRRGEVSSPDFTLHEKPQCYFMVINDMDDEDMDDIFENWKSNVNWNPLAQFVVYMSSVEETAEEMTDIMTEVLLNFMNKKIYNVNIIGQNEEESYFYGKSVFPYHPDNNCGNRVITVETLDLCDFPEGEKDEEEEDEDEEEHVLFSQTILETRYEVENSNELHKGYIAKCSHTDNDLEEKTTNNITDISKRLARITIDNQTSEDSPAFYIEEMYRALFLDKFPKDLSGCPLVAAYRPWEPYIFNEALVEADKRNPMENHLEGDDTYGTGDDGVFDYKSYEDQLNSDGETPMSVEIRLNGIEYKMIQTIGERLHIRIDLQVENKNVYHLFQKLIDGDIEMVVGGIDEDPSISQYVSSTIPYHQDDLTWCVAKARRSYSLFSFMATFDEIAWILTLFFIFAASLSISIMRKYLKIHLYCFRTYFSTNMYVMGVILSQAINLPRIPTSLQLCFGTTFFMGLIFSNVYQSFLISTLTTPKSSYQISHTDEIYANRMNVMGSVDNVRHLSKEGKIFRYVREHFHMCYNIEECLHRAATDPKLAVAVSRQHSFYNPRIPRDHLYCFDRNENIYVYLVTMLLPKKFHLLHKINPVIQHIIESGHMHKWARDLDMRRKIIEEIQRAHEEPFKSLTLHQVAGPFAFSSILLLLALCMFAMEHFIYWLVICRRTRLKLAKFLHRKLQ
ncbi:ionotropic receptor 87a [Haematobia irritans]|uniref:ionotropic receptor 87a n=1 Tax=Haematobia irritans TaxID=7368 RepID=UPI003F502FB3